MSGTKESKNANRIDSSKLSIILNEFWFQFFIISIQTGFLAKCERFKKVAPASFKQKECKLALVVSEKGCGVILSIDILSTIENLSESNAPKSSAG